MKEKVLEILQEIQPSYPFEENVDFIEMGYLDSFDVVMLISELEETFSVAISAIEIIPENFSSIQNICKLIEKSAHYK